MSQVQIDFYGDPCRSCGYTWDRSTDSMLAQLLDLATTYRGILGDLPGTAGHPDLSWGASAYVLHVADNLRTHGERLAAGAVASEPPLFGQPNQDELADLRGYEAIPIAGALWSLDAILVPYVKAYVSASSAGASLPHPARGPQSAVDVLRGNLHDAHHHGWDLTRIVDAQRHPATESPHR